jgi:hypothetical protein
MLAQATAAGQQLLLAAALLHAGGQRDRVLLWQPGQRFLQTSCCLTKSSPIFVGFWGWVSRCQLTKGGSFIMGDNFGLNSDVCVLKYCTAHSF